jgi:hypothetical protein
MKYLKLHIGIIYVCLRQINIYIYIYKHKQIYKYGSRNIIQILVFVFYFIFPNQRKLIKSVFFLFTDHVQFQYFIKSLLIVLSLSTFYHFFISKENLFNLIDSD